jgi:hypothetical protein
MTFEDDFPELVGLLSPGDQTMIMSTCVSKTKVREVVTTFVAPINQEQILKELSM